MIKLYYVRDHIFFAVYTYRKLYHSGGHMMNHLKKYISVLLILTLALSVFSACGKQAVDGATEASPTQPQETVETQTPSEPADSAGYYQIGDKIEDFTITTYDGREISLYKVLEEKEMVLLNLWATWCGPCASEFPAMQEAYAQYQDKVEIIALSVEPTDSNEVLTDYVQEKGMTFCVARDTAGLGSRISYSGIPTSIVVDRFGTICLIEEGAVPDMAVFTNLFAFYTAEDYAESVFLPGMRAEKPNVQPADPAQLNEALNGKGGTLVFTNSTNAFHWPMIVEEKDGRTVAVNSNRLSPDSKAAVETRVDVKAGDVLVIEYKLENNVYLNIMNVEVDGKSVKKSAWDQDWTTYAYRFEKDGSHEVSVYMDIDWMADGFYSNLMIDSIRVVSGDEAAKAMENNPKYPVDKEIQMQLLNENAKKAYIFSESNPDVKDLVYFCSDPTLRVMVTLDETVNPEITFLEASSGSFYPLAHDMTEDCYVLEVSNCKPEDLLGGIWLYSEGNYHSSITIFLSEEQVNNFSKYITEQGEEPVKWEYADETPNNQSVSGDVTYTVTYVDQNGDPVPGVMCQVCDESMCQVFTSDANGICQFTLPAKAYEIHTLKVPSGYEGDTTTITYAPVHGGELTFALTKK